MKRKAGRLKDYIKAKKGRNFKLALEEARMHLKIAHLLEDLRQKVGLTQTELAQKAGVSQPMIARLEKGDQDRIPTLSTINKIFSALGYEVDLRIRKTA